MPKPPDQPPHVLLLSLVDEDSTVGVADVVVGVDVVLVGVEAVELVLELVSASESTELVVLVDLELLPPARGTQSSAHRQQ